MKDAAAFAKLIAREVAAELADGYATARYAPPSEYLGPSDRRVRLRRDGGPIRLAEARRGFGS